jgi:hypothetical protein
MIPIQWKQNDKKTMHVNEAENGVVYLTWPAIEKIEGIRHAFSTRIGGVSKKHLSSMNLSFSRGDDPANVRSGTHNEGPLCDESRLRQRRDKRPRFS